MAKKLRNIMLDINYILGSIHKIIDYSSNMDYMDFIKDTKTIDAIIRNFEIIGEAANQVPKKFKEANKQIEWRILIDFRNAIIH
ncbi:MAG: hypothetical protein HW421_3680 [Ignavibacteria bacterium]|nr:hypothetical protein [Ignavibacteria bacterium]